MQMYICDKRSIDCHDCPHAKPHGSSFCFENRNDECTDAKCITVEKAGWYGPISTIANPFVIDQDKLNKPILDRTKEKEIISALSKMYYDNDELNCLKAEVLAYSKILNEIRTSLGISESKSILDFIESMKNCSNCDVPDEDQCYPDGPCSQRGCRWEGKTLTGWRNPLAQAEDQTIILLSKDDIEEQINEII